METKRSIHHLIFPTTFGPAAIIYREGPFSMIKTLLPRKTKKALLESIEKNEWGTPGTYRKARAVSESLINYFKGNPISRIPWKMMDMEHLTELQREVLTALTRIPYGEVRTYKDIAQAVGHPGASRFVGSTLAKNPFPIIIPCHRVIRSDGSVGQFGGGSELKQRMIELEARNK